MMVKKIILLLSWLNFGFSVHDSQTPATGFAVIELFTSEGCSSCPPADNLIAKIAEENKNRPVYILAYHVDYWNRLGWKDQFSDARYSARQKQYASWLHLKNIYTPQIVVNGSKEFIGSEEKTLRNAILHARSQRNTAKLDIALTKQGEATVLTYQTNVAPQRYQLVVASINPSAKNKIERGENKGKTLSHVQIVRDFKIFALNGKESGTVKLTEKDRKRNANLSLTDKSEIIAFIQTESTGKIMAAAKITN